MVNGRRDVVGCSSGIGIPLEMTLHKHRRRRIGNFDELPIIDVRLQGKIHLCTF